MRITIFSPPGQHAEHIRSQALRAVHNLGVSAAVVVDSDEFDFALAGVMFTPAISINGNLISNGWVPEENEMLEALASVR